MEKHIINVKTLESYDLHLVPAPPERHQEMLKRLRNDFDNFIKNNNEEETEYEEQFEKIYRSFKKYFLEIQNKERGIKAFTLNSYQFDGLI